jgi:hypothetical protein
MVIAPPVTASASHSRVFRLARAPILPSLLPRQRQLPDRPRRHLSPRPREAQVLHRRPADDGDGDERQGAHPDQPGREPGGGHQAGGHLPRHHLPHHVVRGGAGRTPLGDDRFDGAGHDGAPRSEGGAVGGAVRARGAAAAGRRLAAGQGGQQAEFAAPGPGARRPPRQQEQRRSDGERA